MKIDPKLLDALSAMPDDELWRSIREIAAGKGIRLPEKTPPHETLTRLRGAVKEGGTLSLGEAVSIISKYLKEERRS